VYLVRSAITRTGHLLLATHAAHLPVPSSRSTSSTRFWRYFLPISACFVPSARTLLPLDALPYLFIAFRSDWRCTRVLRSPSISYIATVPYMRTAADNRSPLLFHIEPDLFMTLFRKTFALLHISCLCGDIGYCGLSTNRCIPVPLPAALCRNTAIPTSRRLHEHWPISNATPPQFATLAFIMFGRRCRACR